MYVSHNSMHHYLHTAADALFKVSGLKNRNEIRTTLQLACILFVVGKTGKGVSYLKFKIPHLSLYNFPKSIYM